MKISVNAPSYKRPDDVRTLDYLPFCKIWVDNKEYEEYKKHNPKANIISCPDGVQRNVSRVRNYILKTEFERGMDAVVIVDDDLSCIRRFEFSEMENFGYETHIITAEEFLPFVEKYSILAKDLGAKQWGVNCNCDPMAYRHNTPFSTRSVVLGPFGVFLKGNRCWYDEDLPLKEDYDMSIQQLNMERVVLRVNAYHYLCKQSENKGGCAAYRNRNREEEQLDALRKKWGGAIIKVDTTNKGRSVKEKRLDYNPVVRIPIKGV